MRTTSKTTAKRIAPKCSRGRSAATVDVSWGVADANRTPIHRHNDGLFRRGSALIQPPVEIPETAPPASLARTTGAD